ncbi:DinB family protein [Megalodesulfovibrio paquesii]
MPALSPLFQSLARYNRWANARLFEDAAKAAPACLAAPRPVNFGSILGVLNHLLLADRLWLTRLTGEGEAPASVSGMVADSLAALLPLREAEDARLLAFAETLPTANLPEILKYRTTEGKDAALPVAACILHVFNHQTHHRGQVHGLLGQCGASVRDIDYLYFVRDVTF